METAADTFISALRLSGPAWALVYLVICALMATVAGLVWITWRREKALFDYLERSTAEKEKLRDVLGTFARGQRRLSDALDRIARP